MESFSEYRFMVKRDRYGSFCQPLNLRPGTRVQTQHFAVAQCVFHFGAGCLEHRHMWLKYVSCAPTETQSAAAARSRCALNWIKPWRQ